MDELIKELEALRDQLYDFPDNEGRRPHKALVLDLTAIIEKIKVSLKDDKIPDVLAPEDLPDDEDL